MRRLQHTARTAVAVFAAGLVLATAIPAFAQVKLSFKDEGRDYFSAGGSMEIEVAIPAGTRLVRPRFHHIREGDPLPKQNSRGWIEFPEMTNSQDVTIRAPQEEGDWWLVLYDDKKLAARTSFDVMHWTLVLEFKTRRVCRQMQTDQNQIPEGCEQWIGPANPAPVATTTVVSPTVAVSEDRSTGGAPSRIGTSGPSLPSGENRMLQLTSNREIRAGDRADLTVSDPDQKGPRTLELRWANTTELSFAQKKLAPFEGPTFTVSVPDKSSRVPTTVTAPVSPGQYDLLLYGDSKLLDALAVSVK